MSTRITHTLKQLAEAVGSVAGLRFGTEEPRYTVARNPVGGLQIRRYGPRIAAETTVTGSDDAALSTGFRRLAGYIFGANHGKEKIAMTAPVAQQPTAGGGGTKIAMTAPVTKSPGPGGTSVIRFFMPSTWTLDTLPVPDSDTVRLVTVPAETVAVLRFTGRPNPRAVAARQADLLKALESSGFRPTSTPVAWFYDPPWTIPFRRRNEVAVAVSTAGGGRRGPYVASAST